MKNLILFLYFLFFFSSFSIANNPQKLTADSMRMATHLYTITKSISYRHSQNIPALDSVAEYIKTEFQKTCDSVYFQEFQVNGKTYKNVVGSIGLDKKERLIIGAHYDVFGEQEGADDNASGVTGVLELSQLLQNDTLPFRIDFVAYTLEEAPFFDTEQMGSFIHAKYLFENRIHVKGRICLDGIAFFSDKGNSQKYPVDLLAIFYGTTGDYITVVQPFANNDFNEEVERLMLHAKIIKTQSLSIPPTIKFSDHINYWKFFIDAVLITDTAMFRNQHYHKKTDTLETLNINKMKLVIDELIYTIRNLK